jgi:hypothetical protein
VEFLARGACQRGQAAILVSNRYRLPLCTVLFIEIMAKRQCKSTSVGLGLGIHKYFSAPKRSKEECTSEHAAVPCCEHSEGSYDKHKIVPFNSTFDAQRVPADGSCFFALHFYIAHALVSIAIMTDYHHS